MPGGLLVPALTLAAGAVCGYLLALSFQHEEPLSLRPGALPLQEFGRLDLVILAGQSNMSGRGSPGVAPPLSQDLRQRVFIFGNDYRWQEAHEPVDSSRGQVDMVSVDPDAAVGPALYFAARALEREPARRLGLVPCARGASRCRTPCGRRAAWQRNPSDHTLYGSCLKRVRAASTAGRPALLLFYQGEWDGLDPDQLSGTPFAGFTHASDWGDYFVRFANDFRSDLGQPALPIVFGVLGDHANPVKFTHWAEVQESQRALLLEYSARIETAGLPLRDGVHFTAVAQAEIGRRFADAWLDRF